MQMQSAREVACCKVLCTGASIRLVESQKAGCKIIDNVWSDLRSAVRVMYKMPTRGLILMTLASLMANIHNIMHTTTQKTAPRSHSQGGSFSKSPLL